MDRHVGNNRLLPPRPHMRSSQPRCGGRRWRSVHELQPAVVVLRTRCGKVQRCGMLAARRRCTAQEISRVPPTRCTIGFGHFWQHAVSTCVVRERRSDMMHDNGAAAECLGRPRYLLQPGREGVSDPFGEQVRLRALFRQVLRADQAVAPIRAPVRTEQWAVASGHGCGVSRGPRGPSCRSW